MSDGSAVAAYLICAASAFFNGSFPVWQKLSSEVVDPVVFNGTLGIGAFLSSLVVPLIFQVRYLVLGPAMIGGALFIGATLFSFLAISRMGFGPAIAVWSVCAIFVSFFWGLIGPFFKPVGNWFLALLSLVCLALGALVIVSAKDLAGRFCGGGVLEERLSTGQADVPEPERDGAANIDRHTTPLETENAATFEVISEGGAKPKNLVLGLVFALCVGLFGGSVLVPMNFVPKQVNGQDVSAPETVVSFGLGALIAAFVVTQSYWSFALRNPGVPKVQGRTLLAGILSGVTWNLGNIAQIIVQAPEPYNLPYGIAYPFLQCGMFFGGLWSIFVFREVTGKSVLVFWIGSAVMAVGVFLLGAFGPGGIYSPTDPAPGNNSTLDALAL